MPPAKILVVHNRYRQGGGEDIAVEQETALLRRKGHTVIQYLESNHALDETNMLRSGLDAVWSRRTVSRLGKVIDHERPDLVHFHNTFARISPAAYYACRRAGLPVVQTLHNFRTGCLNAGCIRDGAACETCIPRMIPISGIAHGCYGGSRTRSLAMAAITTTHKLLGTYRDQVDAYIALSEFARKIHIRSGIPEHKLFVKPNFSEDQPAPGSRLSYALYVGRLCPEKGIATLLAAWRGVPLPLQIVGDGPDAREVAAAAASLPNVHWLGAQPRAEVLRLMRSAQFLVAPSMSYENCGLCIVEAFSTGLPCIVSGLGSMQEIVENGQTGLHFFPGNAADLRAKVFWMINHPAARDEMGRAAQKAFFSRHTSEDSYLRLLEIYKIAVRMAQSSGKLLEASYCE